MTKSQLIAAAAVRTGLPESEAACVLEAAEELILEALRRGEKVTIAGFRPSGAMKRRLGLK